MIHKITTTCTLLVTLVAAAQTAQKIGDNPTNLHQSAVMEIESSTRGFLPPRMTTVQRNAINSPTAGLVVYNTDTKKLEAWDGTSWSGGGGADNLGNHIATKDLNMGNKSIINVREIDVYNKISIYDQSAPPTNRWVNLWKKDGEFRIWSSVTSRDDFFINETTGKTTLTSAAIVKGTNGIAPAIGQVATAADKNGNIIWKSLAGGAVALPKFELFTTTLTGNQQHDLHPYGGIIKIVGSENVDRSIEILIPNAAVIPIGTMYTIINEHTTIGIKLKKKDPEINGSYSQWFDGIEYNQNNSQWYYVDAGRTIKLWYAGDNKWFSY